MNMKTHETRRKNRNCVCLSLNIGFDDIPFEKSREFMSRYGRSAKTFSAAVTLYAKDLISSFGDKLCAVSMSPMHFLSYGTHGVEAMDAITAYARERGLSVIYDGTFPCKKSTADELFDCPTVFERKLLRKLPDAITVACPQNIRELDVFLPYDKTVFVKTDFQRLKDEFGKYVKGSDAEGSKRTGCSFGFCPVGDISAKDLERMEKLKKTPMLIGYDAIPKDAAISAFAENPIVEVALGSLPKDTEKIGENIALINEKYGKGKEK